MGAEERWAQRMEWAEEKRRGFDACDEWNCGCWESHAWHIEEGEFNIDHCESCAEERCNACKGTGQIGEDECGFCGGGGSAFKRKAEPPEPDYDDLGE